ncbi:MAG: hypothetical protein AAF638_02850 [Pseudomonadota bacterium]
MDAFFSSGRIIDLILGMTIAEVALLLWYYRRTGRGIPPIEAITILLSGAALMLAVRAGLTGVGWPWVALALLAGMVAHMADLAVRWRSR